MGWQIPLIRWNDLAQGAVQASSYQPRGAGELVLQGGRSLLLVNPRSGQGNVELDAVIAALEGIGPVVVPECNDAEAMKEAISSYAGSVSRLVIGGGDGTLNAALPAVMSAALPLGILPFGTANDFARSLGLADPAEAMEAILAGHTREVDVGVVNDRFFLNAVGIGLGPKINKDLKSTTKGRLGVLAYLLQALRHAPEHRGMRTVIDCDGKAVSMRSIHITIGNGIHYGGGMTIASDARLDDGRLRVLAIRPQSLLSLLRYGPSIRSGQLEDDQNLRTFSGRRVSVRTRRASDVTADGEFVTRTPVKCHTLRAALKVYAPVE
jgi:YegS/Rv2252/BmrU family lipid kinase